METESRQSEQEETNKRIKEKRRGRLRGPINGPESYIENED